MFNRTFGIEIEAYNVTRGDVAAALRAAGIECRVDDYYHVTRDEWKVTRDGSITGPKPFELVSPILQGEDGLRQVRVVMETLTAIGAKVNKSCGLHVHFGANDLSLQNFKNLFKHYAKYEDVLDAMQPSDRRASANTYCLSLLKRFRGANHAERINNVFQAIDSARSIQDIYQNLTDDSRYFKLNLASFFRHGTIEVRHHAGTVDADTACNWVMFLGTWIEAAINTRVQPVKESWFINHPQSYSNNFIYRMGRTLFTPLGIPQVAKFYRDRVAQLAGA